MRRIVFLGLLFAGWLAAQPSCPPTPAFSPCELVLDLPQAAATANPNPYLTVELHAEFRSPHYHTYAMPGFWDGGSRFIIRFSPTEPGDWVFRISSNIQAFNGQSGKFTATDSGDLGFIQADNVNHWSHTGVRKPHLWMGDTSFDFAWMDRALFDRMIDARSQQKFNHLRGLVASPDESLRKAYLTSDQPNIEHFRELDQRILAMNRKGLFADLILAGENDHLTKMFPTRQQRERYIRYLVGRYSAMKVTWQGVRKFEGYTNGRALLKEIGTELKEMDPYQQPRSTDTELTSRPLLEDGWMTYVLYHSPDIALGAIERQLLPVPAVNAGFAYENSGSAAKAPNEVDSAGYVRALWNVTMNGQYPTFGNAGTAGETAAADAQYLDSPGAKAMTAWFDFFQRTRYWELEPFFEVDGGRGLTLSGIEYIIYLDKPGPVEVVTEKQKYDVYWFRPTDGQLIPEKKDFKGDHFSGQPPDNNTPWVLHLSRDGKKEDMARSVRFESKKPVMQVVERNVQQVPFEIAEPSTDTLPAGKPIDFSIKLKRETRATGSMMYLWTAEATADNQGYRVIGTGESGKLLIPKNFATNYPAVVNIRLFGMNLNGKVYTLDRVVRVTE